MSWPKVAENGKKDLKKVEKNQRQAALPPADDQFYDAACSGCWQPGREAC